MSFDPRETPELAAAKKKTYLERLGRPGAEAGWHFLTGPQDSITRLTQAVGFHYVYDSKKDQFAHAAGIMVLTPGGKISRYFYDIAYSPRDLHSAWSRPRITRSAPPSIRSCCSASITTPPRGNMGRR